MVRFGMISLFSVSVLLIAFGMVISVSNVQVVKDMMVLAVSVQMACFGMELDVSQKHLIHVNISIIVDG